ncbi:MAG: class II aldolase/adducin family protein [Thermoprotei archaeon]|nr:MAG: class II aldolase/adducin family protein [Thermoprotei archaeon]
MAEYIESEEEIKREIIRVMKTLYNRGLISALGGNVSARQQGSNNIWITPSGVFKGDLHEEDLIKLDLDGNVLEGYMRPSVEWPFHVAIYKVRPDVNAIVHAHNPITTGLALAGITPRPITIESVVTLRKIPVVPFKFPGTDELAKLVAEKIKGGARGLILQNHGVVGVGYNLVEAETIVETLEEVSLTMFASIIGEMFKTICGEGKYPPEISEYDVELTRKIYKF